MTEIAVNLWPFSIQFQHLADQNLILIGHISHTFSTEEAAKDNCTASPARLGTMVGPFKLEPPELVGSSLVTEPSLSDIMEDSHNLLGSPLLIEGPWSCRGSPTVD